MGRRPFSGAALSLFVLQLATVIELMKRIGRVIFALMLSACANTCAEDKPTPAPARDASSVGPVGSGRGIRSMQQPTSMPTVQIKNLPPSQP